MAGRKKETSSTTTKTRKPRTPRADKTETTRQTDDKKPNRVGPLAAAAVIIAALAGRCGFNGFGIGPGILPGGSGAPGVESGAVAGVSSEEAIETKAEVVSTEAVTVEETTAEPLISIVEITVNEDGYLFQNQKCSLEEIFASIVEGDEIHYTVRRASKDDVDDLVNMAQEKGFKIVKID